MNGSRAKKIRKKMKEMGITKETPGMQPRMIQAGTKKVTLKVPAKTILGKPAPGTEYKHEFHEFPIVQRANPYRRLFRSIIKEENERKKK